MRLKVSHTTHYRYDQPAGYGLQELRLTPRSFAGQTVHDWTIAVDGATQELAFDDQHGNRVTMLSFDGAGHDITVRCEGDVETTDIAGVTGRHTGFAPLWYYQHATPLTRAGNNTRKLIKGLAGEVEDAIARLHALSERVLEAITYDTGHTDALTTAEDALGAGHGVCQDHAHVFIAAARALGYPARYVSGYLLMTDRVDQEASHGWAEAHVDGIGWIGFDVSNQICPNDHYIRLATGLDYRQAAPIHGLRIGPQGEEDLAVSIQVQQ